MNNPAPSAQDRWPLARRLKRDNKAAGKIVSRFSACNPLKNLNSDERIQANPRQSNPLERRLRSQAATKQENPNGSPTVDTEAERRHSNNAYRRTIRRGPISAQALQTGASLTVVRVDLHSALVRLDSFRVVVQFFVAKSETCPSLRVVSVDVERGVEVLDRRIVFAGGHQALAAGLVWLARERGRDRSHC